MSLHQHFRLPVSRPVFKRQVQPGLLSLARNLFGEKGKNRNPEKKHKFTIVIFSN